MAFNPSEQNVIRTYLAVTGSAPTQDQLENAFVFASLEAFSRDLTAGNTQTNVEFVESLYQNLLGRDADDLGLEYWTSLMSASQGLNALTKAEVAVAFQGVAAVEAELGNEPAMTEALGEIIVSGDLSETDLDFGDVDAPVEEDPDLVLDFSFDTTVGESDVKGWEHTGGDSDEDDDETINDGAADANYESQTHKIFNIGKQAVDLDVDTISAQYEFSLIDQLGEQGKYEAYFISPTLDNTSISQGSSLTLEIIDRTAESDDEALDFVAVQSFDFYLDGERVVVSSADILAATTYEELRDAIADELSDLGYDDELTVTLGSNFSRQQVDPETLDTTGGTVTGQQIVITAATAELDRGTFETGQKASSETERNIDPSARMSDNDVTITEELITTNLVLENVGYGSQGGSINIAGQSQSDKGVEQFNIVAQEGNQDLGVWLTELTSVALQDASQANQLEVVNLTGDASYFYIGQEQEGAILDGKGVDWDSAAGLIDVIEFNGDDFDGDIEIAADITDAVISRDLNLVDDADAPAADNVTYSYNTGEGDDTVLLDVAGAAVAHEDFELEVNTGAGDDTIIVDLEFDNNGLEFDFDNQNDLNNVEINSGSGDDFVWTPGSGDIEVNAGAGDDVVWSDNTAAKAQWVLHNNAATDDNDADDLDGNPLTSSLLYKATLTVDFAGFEASATIPTTGYTANQAQINQAIKAAINESDVLSKLIVATDGPDNTLIITSIIDGTFIGDDLTIDIEAVDVDDLTTTEVNNLEAYLQGVANDSDTDFSEEEIQDALDAGVVEVAPVLEGDENVIAAGEDSDEETNDVINAGTGDDVVVLSSGEGADTIEFTGYNNGTVTVAHFDAREDSLGLSAYYNTVVSSSGSTISQTAATDAMVNTIVDIEFDGTATDTFAGLTTAVLFDLLTDSTAEYGNLDGSDVYDDVVADFVDDLVGFDRDVVVRVHNADNPGEYRLFHVVSTQGDDSSDDIEVGSSSDVKLISDIDIGDEEFAPDVANSYDDRDSYSDDLVDGESFTAQLGREDDTLTLDVAAGADLTVTVDLDGGEGNDTVVFDFADVNDTVTLTSTSTIDSFETLEVSGGTLDITNLAAGALDGVNVVINSGLTLSVAQLIELVTSGGSLDTETLGSGLNIELEDSADASDLQNFLGNAANAAALDAILGASTVNVTLNVVDASEDGSLGTQVANVVSDLGSELSNAGAINSTDGDGITTLTDGSSFDRSGEKGDGHVADEDPTIDLTDHVLEDGAEVTVIVAEYDSENGNKSDLAEVAKSDQLVVLPDLADLNDGTLVIENFTMATQTATDPAAYTTNDVLDFSNTSEATDAAALAGLVAGIEIVAGDGDYLDVNITLDIDGESSVLSLANVINSDAFDAAIVAGAITEVTGASGTYTVGVTDANADMSIDSADAAAELIGLIAAGGTFEYA